jgi:hypothetical protein
MVFVRKFLCDFAVKAVLMNEFFQLNDPRQSRGLIG